jgi:hypothetical protein
MMKVTIRRVRNAVEYITQSSEYKDDLEYWKAIQSLIEEAATNVQKVIRKIENSETKT